MATYVIGDLQGCLDEFEALLEKVDFGASDRLWLVGDLINRGPDSLGTLRKVRALAGNTRVVLGNHDLHFLAIYFGGHKPSSTDTFDALLQAADIDEMAHWLRQQPLAHYDPQHDVLMTHAGIPPGWTVKQTLALAAEVEAVLISDSYNDLLANLYGNEGCWDAGMDGLPRLRCITNHLTRMRLLDERRCLNFSHKGQLADAPDNLRPWFAVPRQDSKRWRATRFVFGHWAALDGHTGVARMLALDTGAVWGRDLTAYRLEDGRLFSVAAQT